MVEGGVVITAIQVDGLFAESRFVIDPVQDILQVEGLGKFVKEKDIRPYAK